VFECCRCGTGIDGVEMAELQYDRFTARDGISLAYRLTGSGTRVVLVHGYTVNSEANFARHRQRGPSGVVETEGPTVESALVRAGCQLAMLDLRGHGRSESSRLPERYSTRVFADDVRALVAHLGWDRAAVVGYSLGAWIVERLLSDPWVSRAALCGIGTNQLAGRDAGFEDKWKTVAKCFLEGCWADHPENAMYRESAERYNSDFAALGYVAASFEPVPIEELQWANVPVLVLNGGADAGAQDEHDLTPFIPGARRVIAGYGDHGTAPSDPLFQAELCKFLTATSW
jgi:pimeloyl-ACP methyl ester carboxylesterase